MKYKHFKQALLFKVGSVIKSEKKGNRLQIVQTIVLFYAIYSTSLHLLYSLHAACYAERGGDGRRTAGFACLEENIFSLKGK